MEVLMWALKEVNPLGEPKNPEEEPQWTWWWLSGKKHTPNSVQIQPSIWLHSFLWVTSNFIVCDLNAWDKSYLLDIPFGWSPVIQTMMVSLNSMPLTLSPQLLFLLVPFLCCHRCTPIYFAFSNTLLLLVFFFLSLLFPFIPFVVEYIKLYLYIYLPCWYMTLHTHLPRFICIWIAVFLDGFFPNSVPRSSSPFESFGWISTIDHSNKLLCT